MSHNEINEIKRLFISRLDTLGHVLSQGEKHFGELDSKMDERLAPDMFTLGAQVAVACNQARGFAQWCADEPIDNLSKEVHSLATARDIIAQTKELVAAISVDDAKLDNIKRIGLGPGRYCELPARQYLSEYLLPNLYFHITTAYAILRHLGAPLGKADFMAFLAPHVRLES
ncbi:DUF1993 domain-containing protein [Shewanella cyperi]|uniref:DUF1993 domain-containing protein n=1 Tax=Shewanella cyperi TaxID=2814292 RepID=A0A974XIF4_9GAMM|nr:DUF1993 domain-containing protein [Shewanella cyperi]QSX28985.1 DUF1993 domain-containing protein [Shewanella cyperi]QSX39716.1 DUF1993 domain-containing protein [Shewanella cyperi]